MSHPEVEQNPYFAYLWATNSNGLLEQIKFMKNLDVKDLKVGDKITSFYGDTYSFFNVVDYEKTWTPEGLKSISEVGVGNVASVRNLCSDLIFEAQRIPHDDLQGKRDNESILDVFVNALHAKGVEIKYNVGEFNLENYIKAHNNLLYEASCIDNKTGYPILAMVNVFDAFAFNCGYFKTGDGVEFFRPEEDVNVDEYEISYSEIMSGVYYFEKLKTGLFLMTEENQNSPNGVRLKR